MGRSYSLDLRWRVVSRVEGRRSRRGAAADLQVSPSFSVKLVARHRRTGTLGPHRQGRPLGTGKLAPYGDFLMGRVRQTPDITMPELATELETQHGVAVDPASLSRFLRKAGLTHEKTLLAEERARSDVAKACNVWIHKRQPIMRAMPHRLVFIDETSTTAKLTRLRGRAMTGERLPGAVPFGHCGRARPSLPLCVAMG
jgi:transposase